jgi:hypothetical protein
MLIALQPPSTSPSCSLRSNKTGSASSSVICLVGSIDAKNYLLPLWPWSIGGGCFSIERIIELDADGNGIRRRNKLILEIISPNDCTFKIPFH